VAVEMELGQRGVVGLDRGVGGLQREEAHWASVQCTPGDAVVRAGCTFGVTAGKGEAGLVGIASVGVSGDFCTNGPQLDYCGCDGISVGREGL
jgi:hypothetical protein